MLDLRNLRSRFPAVLLACATFVAAAAGFCRTSHPQEEPLVNWQPEDDPPDVPPPPPPPLPEPRRFESPFLSSRRPVRLARVPDMFGDFFASTGQLLIDRGMSQQNFMTGVDVIIPAANFFADAPLAGGTSHFKAADNNKALPDDRAYFLYNHFENALASQNNVPVGPIVRRNVDRYTLGFEKTIFDGLTSIEVRMPVSGTFHFRSLDGPAAVSVQGGKAGNLALLLKRLVHSSEDTAIAVGCGLGLPTGSDVHIQTQVTGEAMIPGMGVMPVTENLSLVINNESVHFQPFVAVAHAIGDRMFFHGFFQADLAAGSNPVVASFNTPFSMTPPIANQQIGKFTQQNLLYFDGGAGYWLHRNPDAWVLQGLAGLLELHYATTLQHSDAIAAAFPPTTTMQIVNTRDRVDIFNMTAGLHFQLGDDSALRVAAVLPVKGFDNRFFDAEVWVAYIKQL